MEEVNLDKIATEFKSDSDILKMINTVKDARREYEKAKSHHAKEELKRKKAEELFKRKCRKLLLLQLSNEIEKLDKDTKSENEVYKKEKQRREEIEGDILKVDKSKYL